MKKLIKRHKVVFNLPGITGKMNLLPVPMCQLSFNFISTIMKKVSAKYIFAQSQKEWGRCRGSIVTSDPMERQWVFTRRVIGADNKKHIKEAVVRVASNGTVTSNIILFVKEGK